MSQDFNSLDAQQDAAQAYIRSQAHAGWTVIRSRYEDGGYSGGSTDRPALQRLLADVKAGKVDVIVVYKVPPPVPRWPENPRGSRHPNPTKPEFIPSSQQARRGQQHNTFTAVGRGVMSAGVTRTATQHGPTRRVQVTLRRGLVQCGSPYQRRLYGPRLAVNEPSCADAGRYLIAVPP